MKYGNELKPLTPDPIRNEIGSLRHDKLPRPDHPARPANLGVSLQKIYCFEDALSDEDCILFGILLDICSQVNKITNCPAGPDNLHRGAFVSPGLPHVLSHFDTFSWLTSCPESSSAIPM